MRLPRPALLILAASVAAAACSEGSPRSAPGATPTPEPAPEALRIVGEPGPSGGSPAPPPAPVPRVTTTARTAGAVLTASTATTQATPGTPVDVPYRLERRTSDPATAGFEAFARSTLGDPKGWSRAGFRLVHRADAKFTVVLAEGTEVDKLCLPYDTYGQYSCQNGPTVALNADRWRTATPKWTGSLDDYRRYLVGHEVGHLLGLRHPRVQCPAAGQRAPLMGQQSTELNGCLPNPWPLDSEVAVARRRPADLAPPYRP